MFRLYIKTISLLIFGQQKQEFSMLIKEFWKSKFRVILSMIRLTNSYCKQLGGSRIPNVVSIALSGNLLYVISKLQEWSNVQSLSKAFNAVENLRIVNNDKHKNSGCPENWEIWGYGGTIVRGSCSSVAIRKSSSLETTMNFILLSSEVLGVDLKNFNKQIVEHIRTGKKIKGLSNILGNPRFLLLCYYRLNKRFTRLDNKILDKNMFKWFRKISKNIRDGSYNFHYPTKEKITFGLTKRKRSLANIVSLKDRVIWEAIWQLLEFIYRKVFIDISHTFKSNKNYRAILNQIRMTMGHTIWFIKGDMSRYFDGIDYNFLVSKVNRIIEDQSFINLVYKVLCIGYEFPNRKVISTYLKLTQREAIVSLLSNIFLYEFDMKMLEFAKSFNKNIYWESNLKCIGIARNKNRVVYSKLGNIKFKELKYIRYTNNFLIGVIGSKEDCMNIKLYIQNLLEKEFKSKLTINGIKITYAKSNNTFFLGCNIRMLNFSKNKLQYLSEKNEKFEKTKNRLKIDIPIKRVISRLNNTGYCKANGSPTRFGKLIHKPIAKIILSYKILQSNLLSYYSIADNYKYISARICYTLKYSCALTIASKMKLKTLKKVFDRFGTNLKVKKK